MLVKQVAKFSLGSDQMHTHRQSPAREDRPANLELRCFVGTYGIQRDVNQHGAAPVYLAASSGLDPAAEPSQRFPAGVARTLFAGASLAVAVLAAARAKSLAVELAQRPDRQRQKHLLAQHILKQQTVLLIITDFSFPC